MTAPLVTIPVNNKVLGDTDTTYTLQDLFPKGNNLSAIVVVMAGTGGASGVALSSYFSRIEVTASKADGQSSGRLKFIKGIAMRMFAQLLTGKLATLTNADGAASKIVVPIMFGRYIGDPLYALDTRKWNSLMLKLTFTAVGATTFAASNAKLTVTCYQLLGPGIAKFLAHESPDEGRASAASGLILSSGLPVGDPISKILCYASGTDGTTCTDVAVKVNSSERIPFTGRWVEVQENTMQEKNLIGLQTNFALVHDARNYLPDECIGKTFDGVQVSDLRVEYTNGAASQTFDTSIEKIMSN